MTPVLTPAYKIKNGWRGITIESRPAFTNYILILIASTLLAVAVSFLLRSSLQLTSEEIVFLAVLLSILCLGLQMVGRYHCVSISPLDGTLTMSTREGNIFIAADEIVSLRVMQHFDAFSGQAHSKGRHERHRLEIELADGRKILLVDQTSSPRLLELAGIILNALDLPSERVSMESEPAPSFQYSPHANLARIT